MRILGDRAGDLVAVAGEPISLQSLKKLIEFLLITKNFLTFVPLRIRHHTDVSLPIDM